MPCGRRWVGATSAWSDALQGVGRMSPPQPSLQDNHLGPSGKATTANEHGGTGGLQGSGSKRSHWASPAEGWEPSEVVECGGHVGGSTRGEWAGGRPGVGRAHPKSVSLFCLHQSHPRDPASPSAPSLGAGTNEHRG